MRLSLSIISLALATIIEGYVIEQSVLHIGDNDHFVRKNPVPGNNSLQYCDSNQNYDILRIQSLNFTVEPQKSTNLKRESKLLVNLTAELTQSIEDGATVDVLVTFGRIIVYSNVVDLCKEEGDADSKCPIEKGFLTFQKEIVVPKPWLKHILTAKANFFNYDQKRITCLISDPHYAKFEAAEEEIFY